MNQYQIKLIKWGLIFFTEPATLNLDPAKVEVVEKDGNIVLSCGFSELKKANFNSMNGMWTLVSTNGQKCNVVIKDEQASNQLQSSLDEAGVKGISV